MRALDGRLGCGPTVEIAVLLAWTLLTYAVRAQCSSQWMPGEPVPGVYRGGYCLALLPNGDIVVGGFTVAGDLAANVAAWDGARWRPMGAGVNGSVWAAKVLPSGD